MTAAAFATVARETKQQRDGWPTMAQKHRSRIHCTLSSWSSPEDVLGILVLLTAFPLVALDLVRTGGWRGCALSAAWCVTYEDSVGRTDGLPQGTWTSRVVAMIGAVSAFYFRYQSLRKRHMSIFQIRSTRIKVAIGSLLLSNVALLSCAFIPMSCGCLRDGNDWVYVSWRDYIHDASLWTIYISTILSGFAAGYGKADKHNKKIKRNLLYATVVFAVLQSIGIYRCPTSPANERLVLLLLEVVAIALTQFLHYGTIQRLLTEYSKSTLLRGDAEKKEALLPLHQQGNLLPVF